MFDDARVASFSVLTASQFNDPVLDALVDAALSANRDVHGAPAGPLRASVLPIGTAEDILRRRRDVAAAELRVVAASARVNRALGGGWR